MKRPPVDWTSVRIHLWMRCGGRCEFCGVSLRNRAEVHHRQLRSQGGSDDPVNLAFVHPECHFLAHMNPEAARAHGWIVSGWGDPAQTPVTVCRTRLTSCSHAE